MAIKKNLIADLPSGNGYDEVPLRTWTTTIYRWPGVLKKESPASTMRELWIFGDAQALKT